MIATTIMFGITPLGFFLGIVGLAIAALVGYIMFLDVS